MQTMGPDWHRVADRDALGVGEVVRVVAAGREIALYNVDGLLYATADTCTHARASLSQGYLEGEEIECPLHQARFHVPTGRVLCRPATESLDVYAVRVADDGIYVSPTPMRPESLA